MFVNMRPDIAALRLAPLDVIERTWGISLMYGAMQAFYLKTGISHSACQEAPSSGIIIQTPQGPWC